jgi:DNA-binding helix-hairpin-helix protein with protein kinase domain
MSAFDFRQNSPSNVKVISNFNHNLKTSLPKDYSEDKWWHEICEEEDRLEDVITIYGPSGKPQRLSKRMARGGEGSIYPVEGNPNILVKIYHDKILNDAVRTQEAKGKLKAMMNMEELKEERRLGWPQIPVFDENKRWIGYAMRRCRGELLHLLCAPISVRQHFPHWDRVELVDVVLNLIGGLQKLHENRVMAGDVNTANFLVDENANIAFIDCDSYHVSAGNKVYACPVRTDLFTAPEALDISPASLRRNSTHELFSDAVLFYQVIMLGPYARVHGEDPVSNLRSGKCALGTGSGCRLPKGPWYNMWSHLSFDLKDLFIRAFREGHGRPKARPSLTEWQKTFIEYRKMLVDYETHCRDLIPENPKASGYQGKNPKIRQSSEG